MSENFTKPSELFAHRQIGNIFLHEKQLISWQQFCANVAQLKSELTSNIQQNCALHIENSLHFAIAFFAALLAKKRIFLPQNAQPETLKSLPPHLFISEVKFNKNAKIDKYDLGKISTENEITFFTSGSSGEAKRIDRKFAQLEAEVCDLAQTWHEDSDLLVASVSHQHIYGLLFRILMPLSQNILTSSSLTFTPEDLNIFAEIFNKITLVSSPAFLKRLSADDTIKPNFVRIFSSGGLLAKEDATRAQQLLKIQPIEILGSTETGGVAWRKQSENEAWHKFASVSIKLNENDVLAVKSPYCYVSDFIEMGDTAKLLDENSFLLLGRKDRIVKIEEKRISLTEIENRLAQHDLVKQCFAITLQSKRQSIGAAVELSKNGEEFLHKNGKIALNSELTNWLRKYFENIAIPRKWRYVSQLPMNSQSKITQQKIKELFGNECANN